MCSLRQWANRFNLEKTQKRFLKLILDEDYTYSNEAIQLVNLAPLEKRRKILTKRFVKTCLANGLLRDLFPKRPKHTS